MFTSIYQVMQEGQSLSLHLIRKGDKLVVCFQPLASNAPEAPGSNLTPLVITATPSELEEGFITAIRTPLEERFGLLSNLEEFKKSTQKAQPRAKDKTEVAGTVSVEPASNALPKKSKREEQAESAEKMARSGNLPGAYGIYKKLYEQDKSDTRAGNRMHELWAKMSQKTMFPQETEEQPNRQPVIPAAGQPQAVTSQGGDVITPIAPLQPEVNDAEEDMFAQILYAGRIEEPVQEAGPAAEAEDVKAAPIPPGFDPARYEEFLRYQEFLKTQPVPETV